MRVSSQSAFCIFHFAFCILTVMIEYFIRNPVKVAVGVILVAMFGVLALLEMPLQLAPDVQRPSISVETRWPGATPAEVEKEIVHEQEEQLKNVEGVSKMSSESSDSRGEINLEFDVGTNMQEALVNVNTRLAQVREYPIDADEPVISTSNLSDRPIAWFMLTPVIPTEAELAAFVERHPHLAEIVVPLREKIGGGLFLYRYKKIRQEHPEVRELDELNISNEDVPKLRRFAEDTIEAAFERVPGVSAANVVGGEDEELQVVVDIQKLAARQLTIAQVAGVLRAENKDTSGGDFWEGKRRIITRTLGKFESPEDVENVILARRDGAPVYVRDVAEVRIGFKKPDSLTRRFGQKSMALNAMRKVGANIIDVQAGLTETMNELNETVLKQRGLQLQQVYDETQYIQSSIDLVTDNIVSGGILTFFTLLLFLRSGRSTVIIGLHILISTIGAFLAMWVMGRSLNVLCLGGLAFAVGMLVDNAIVMLENIYRRNQNGEAPIVAAARGAKEVWGALVNASVVNLAVFLPVVFMQDEAGQLFRDIALAISASVALSLAVAIAVVPTMATRLLKPGREDADKESDAKSALTSDCDDNGDNGDVPAIAFVRPGTNGQPTRRASAEPSRIRRGIAAAWERVHTVLDPYVLQPSDRLGGWFVGKVVAINERLQRGLAFRLVVAAGFIAASLIFAWLLFPKVEYLPNGNRNLVIGFMQPPPGYNMDHLMDVGDRIESKLRPYWDVAAGSEAAKQLDGPIIADFFFVVRNKSLFMGVRADDPMRAKEMIPLLLNATADVPGMRIFPSQASLFEQGLTGGRSIDVEISGPDIRKLVALGGQIIGQVDPMISTEATKGAAIPKPSLDLANPEMHIERRKEVADDLAISSSELGATVDALVDGAYVTDYFIGGTKIDLRIMGDERFIVGSQDVASLPIATPSGHVVPLGSVANVSLSSGPEQINRREQVRAITIQVRPAPEIPLEAAMDRIENEIVKPMQQSGILEAGTYKIGLSGTADKLRDTWTSLRMNFLLAVVITYLLMAALFESWLYPFVIMTSVPLGAVGGFVGLWLLNLWVLQPLDALTMLGFVILVGTVVNNPILIVEQALIHMREEGMSPRAGIIEAVRIRIRPIFMTTIGGLIGLLPLVIAPGAGSELYRGIGAVLLGGMVITTVFTLVLVPTLFTLCVDIRDALAIRWGLWSQAAPLDPEMAALAGGWPAPEDDEAIVAEAAEDADEDRDEGQRHRPAVAR
ncbi:MAG: AcrB/AcrD/AcrF family protein [Planctomycetota bacterium]|nr:MAG: AcrB/AcrD/AcrF family protein [Planctomycetota bacterium]